MSNEMSSFARTIMEQKYSHTKKDGTKETWEEIAKRVTKHVMRALPDVDSADVKKIETLIREKKFMPGGRYLYAAGNPYHQTQNCLLLRADDSREGWAELAQKSTMALMTGAGIGIDYSAVRPEGSLIRKTGGTATGPLALMQMLNEVGRGVMQGGSRRCLPAHSKVTLATGERKEIKDIQIGDLVATRLGPRKVTNVWNQGIQKIIEITTEYGKVAATQNHKWLAADRTRRKTWMTTGDLSVNNKLYYHPYKEDDSGRDSIDLEFAYTLGYFMGDGCAYHSNRTHEITFQISNAHYSQAQVDLISRVMSLQGTNPIVRAGNGDCTEIRCRNKQLVNVWQQYKTPHMPPNLLTILNYDNKSLAAFLSGWFDADGYFGEDSWKLANTHASTRQELQLLFRRLGILTTENGIELKICSHQKALFKELIGIHSFKEIPSINKETSEIPAKITAINTIGVQQTYDIEVEVVHEFFADDFVSHNSAIWAGLNWKHADIHKFIRMKNWIPEVSEMKSRDFNFPATMDGTNISVILEKSFFDAQANGRDPLHAAANGIYWSTIEQMVSTGEPGMSIDYENPRESLRNACTEVTSEDDSDICNLGSINLARIDTLQEFREVIRLGVLFLLAGTVYSDVPYPKVDMIRTKNRRLGLGIMGIHEWLLKRGYRYQMTDELNSWLEHYRDDSLEASIQLAEAHKLTAPVKVRAIAPTGTIGILAETSTGIEPIFCVAYKRRYLKGQVWQYQYVVDPTAKRLIEGGVAPDKIEDAYMLSEDPERRIKFQADMQYYVDHAISSTLNLPHWGSPQNNTATMQDFGKMLLKYLPRLRGITCYPDGARGGQPLTPVKYQTAIKHTGEVFLEQADVCDLTKGGSCGS